MKNFNELRKAGKQMIINHIIDELSNNLPENISTYDLHNRLFNEDYFFIYNYQINDFRKENELNDFKVIEAIKDYEESNFGEFNTMIDEFHIYNMLIYIIGEEVFYSLDCVKDNDEDINEELIEEMIEELNNLI